MDPDTGKSKTTGMRTNDIEYILFTGSGVDADREQCAFDVTQYCNSDQGQKDPACIGTSCEKAMRGSKEMCTSEPGLKDYFELPLCKKAKCIEYQNNLVTLYGKRGYFQPGDSWQEGYDDD